MYVRKPLSKRVAQIHKYFLSIGYDSASVLFFVVVLYRMSKKIISIGAPISRSKLTFSLVDLNNKRFFSPYVFFFSSHFDSLASAHLKRKRQNVEKMMGEEKNRNKHVSNNTIRETEKWLCLCRFMVMYFEIMYIETVESWNTQNNERERIFF